MENQLAVIENITDIKTLTVNAITENQSSVEKALIFGENLYKEVSNGMDEDKDAKIKKYIGNVNATIKAMNERRRPATQLFDRIKKGFTTLENALSVKDETTVVYKLQKIRDDYAAEKIRKAEEERKRIAREQLFLSTIENYKSEYKNAITDAGSRAIEATIAHINSVFSSITLDNIVEKENELRLCYGLSFDTKSILPPERPAILDELTIRKAASLASDESLDSIKQQFQSEIKDLLDDLLLKIPSKKQELEKIAKQSEEEAKKAKEELARRDAEEAARKELERKAEEDKKKQADALAANKAEISSLFDAASTAPATTAKITKKIEVLDAKGFLNIIQLWWMGEGANMTIEELSKKLKFAVTYAEKQANKDNLIESPYINYVDDVKAK